MVNKSTGWGGSRKGAGRPRKNLSLDEETALLLAKARKRLPDGTSEEEALKQALQGLAFMASDVRSLTNHAEVLAPGLVNNPQWRTLKAHLEQCMEEIGVTAFIESVGEQYRQQIEDEED